MRWDVFISYATEDKSVATPLALALRHAGLSVWYDEYELHVGDRLRRSIETGLRNCRFGIVILSPAFFKKHWPQLELDALAQREEGGQKLILPIWHNVTVEEVRKHSPLLADRIAAKWDEGLNSVVADLLKVIANPDDLSFSEIEITLSDTWDRFLDWLHSETEGTMIDSIQEHKYTESTFYCSGKPGHLNYWIRVSGKKHGIPFVRVVDVVTEWLHPLAVELVESESCTPWDTSLFPVKDEFDKEVLINKPLANCRDCIYFVVFAKRKTDKFFDVGEACATRNTNDRIKE